MTANDVGVLSGIVPKPQVRLAITIVAAAAGLGLATGLGASEGMAHTALLVLTGAAAFGAPAAVAITTVVETIRRLERAGSQPLPVGHAPAGLGRRLAPAHVLAMLGLGVFQAVVDGDAGSMVKLAIAAALSALAWLSLLTVFRGSVERQGFRW